MEIIQQRLEREEDMDLVQTAPNVTYHIVTNDGVVHEIRSPSEMPDPAKIDEYREPIVEARIVVPTECIGAVMKLSTDRRGLYKKTEYYGAERVMISFDHRSGNGGSVRSMAVAPRLFTSSPSSC